MNDTDNLGLYEVCACNICNEESLTSLMLLYEPIIGSNAKDLYLFLYFDNINNCKFNKINRLLGLLNVPYHEFYNLLSKLEEYKLVQTYYNKTTSNYIFKLLKPLSFVEFVDNDFYNRRLIQVIGIDMYNDTINKLFPIKKNLDGYVDVSHKLNLESFKDWDEENESELLKIKQDQDLSDNHSNINFDYDGFFNIVDGLVFPYCLRTNDVLKMIGEYASIYGIEIKDMKLIVSKCSDPFSKEFNKDLFKRLCKKYEVKSIDKNKDPYLLPSISFLQAKQNGAKVIDYERSLIEHLKMDLNLNNEVINVIVEYALNNGNNRLNKNFVDSIAASMIRENITNYKDALAYLNAKPNKTKKAPKVIEKPNFEENIEDLTDEQILNLQAWLKEH